MSAATARAHKLHLQQLAVRCVSLPIKADGFFSPIIIRGVWESRKTTALCLQPHCPEVPGCHWAVTPMCRGVVFMG